MLSLAIFGVGFLRRPLGAIVLGAYIDHHGRRKGLILTLALMSFGTFFIACVPGYNMIGILAHGPQRSLNQAEFREQVAPEDLPAIPRLKPSCLSL